MAVDKVERLGDLIALLLGAGRPQRLIEIISEVPGYPEDEESARVSFNRDKAVLADEGIEVVTTEWDGEPAYRIDPDTYYLPDLGLTEAETVALNVALSAVALQGADVLPGATKLGAVPAGGGAMVALDVAPVLPLLHDAVCRRATVAFTYKDKARVVEPYGLLTREGWWYLVGRDRGHDDDNPRNFRVDRIEGEVTVGEGAAFDRPADLDLRAALPTETWRLGSEEAVEAEVLVDRAYADRAVREVGPDRVVARRDDGSVVVRLSVTSPEGFTSWLLGLLDHARVLAPPSLVDHVVARLRAQAEAQA